MLNRIKSLCRERKVTLSQLATDIKIDASSIYRWSTNTPSADKLKKVADYFGVSVDYLLGRQAEACDVLRGSILETLQKQATLLSERSHSTCVPNLELTELTKALVLVADSFCEKY